MKLWVFVYNKQERDTFKLTTKETYMEIMYIFLSVTAGLAIGIILMIMINKAGLNRDQQKASKILEDAQTKADNTVKQAILDGRHRLMN